MGCFFLVPRVSCAADTFAGSLGLTSDYLVRGITRSADDPALQADLHFDNSSGFFAGLFASSVRIGAERRRDAELSAFSGWAHAAGDSWRGKATASYYSYPWSPVGSKYNYVELAVDATHSGWLNLAAVYSPDAPRFLPHRGLIAVASLSTEFSVRAPLALHWAAVAGAGYSHLGGPQAAQYGYGSLGVMVELARYSVSLSYVATTAGADRAYYEAAARGRWAGTVIWRF